MVSGMVVWHDCQIEKFENQGKPQGKWFAAVAPIIPFSLAQMNEEARETVRSGERRAFFHLAAWPEAGVQEEGFVDLRHVLPIRQSWLLERRTGALSETVRQALHLHYFTFLTQRQLIPDFGCPQCGNKISIDTFAPPVTGDD